MALVAESHNKKSYVLKPKDSDVSPDEARRKYGRALNRQGARWSGPAEGWLLSKEKFEALKSSDSKFRALFSKEENGDSKEDAAPKVKRSLTKKMMEKAVAEKLEEVSSRKKASRSASPSDKEDSSEESSSDKDSHHKSDAESSDEEEDSEREKSSASHRKKTMSVKEYRRSKPSKAEEEEDVITLSRKVKSLQRRDKERESQLKTLRSKLK